MNSNDFSWIDYLELAKNLQTAPTIPGPEEAALRSATSRAYYAAYQLALEFAVGKGYVPHFSGDDHRGLVRFFHERQEDRTRMRIGSELDRLRDSRRVADYERILKQSPRAMADLTVKRAQSVIEMLNSMPR